MLLPDIVVILCRVSGPENVGAVCRAMKNMGLSRLRIAGTARESLDGGAIRARALHAADLWEGAAFFDTLADAAADCPLLIGTTRRRGRHRKQASLSPRQLAAWLRERPGPAALVFGNERTGLEDQELDLCHIASHIPVSRTFPSLNLSHAAQIYAYELFLALETGPDPASGAAEAVKGAWVPLNHGEAAGLAGNITNTLETLGFYRHPGREIQERFLRDLICRAGLTTREGAYLADIFAKAARLAGKK
ncbi:MAG: TrmJ/YjtD family RNA methyltransferase [Treponema sp.]|jgi:tRNA/rRNA methyltransferase/tRNA (cytidine32/uridine32-2'-O)-methyltransferase|nr:TrmJ/YjtD family RNA methyltransferase [Treponema sp.]